MKSRPIFCPRNPASLSFVPNFPFFPVVFVPSIRYFIPLFFFLPPPPRGKPKENPRYLKFPSRCVLLGNLGNVTPSLIDGRKRPAVLPASPRCGLVGRLLSSSLPKENVNILPILPQKSWRFFHNPLLKSIRTSRPSLRCWFLSHANAGVRIFPCRRLPT